MDKKTISEAAATMARKGYRVRLERYGLERIREIARENGKKGGRPRKAKMARPVMKGGRQ